MPRRSSYDEDLREYVFSIKTIGKDKIKSRFDQMDNELWSIIEFLVYNTNFVQPRIVEIYYTFLIGNDHNKSSYLHNMDIAHEVAKTRTLLGNRKTPTIPCY
jgi:hypothetical protein